MHNVKIFTNPLGRLFKCVWKGELSFIPPVGESILIKNNLCMETVKKIDYIVCDNEVHIFLETHDHEDLYDALPY